MSDKHDEMIRINKKLSGLGGNCLHHHTGSCSPEGVYLYVRCQDCGELLAISEEGKKRLRECDGYRPSRTGHSRVCLDCGFDYYDHEPPTKEE